METLEYEVDNEDGDETIIFLHSLFQSSKESIPVVHYLPRTIHVIRPSIQPRDLSDLEESSAKVADLIHKTARKGKAHVIGLGIGARIALTLAKSYPDLVNSLFLMGYNTHRALIQPILVAQLYLSRRRLVRGTKRPLFSLTQCRQILRILCSPAQTDKRRISVPTLILVGLLDDSVEDAKDLKESSSWGSETVKTIGAAQLHHLWHIHDADVMAGLIAAWIESKKRSSSLSECLKQDFMEV